MTTSIFKGDSPPVKSVEDLVEHFREGEKPREKWRIGTEHEKMLFSRNTHQPIPYEGEGGIRGVLEAFRTRFGWEPIHEGKNLIALSRDEASITLEPGGQFELSGAAVNTAHDTCQELSGHVREMREVAEDLGITTLTLGRNPIVPSADMPGIPKERYAIMRAYLPTRGAMATDMMHGTGTVQTNIDYSDEQDMGRKMRLGHALAPFLIALFANSPFAEGRATGYLSTRGLVWQHTDPDRSGFIPGALKEGFGYRDYAEYALDVPMFFIHREGRYVDYSGRSFRAFMADGFDDFEATREDWELHLTTLFPMMRMKQYLELRMADGVPLNMICAFSALTRGVFYDDTALAEAEHLITPIPIEAFPGMEQDAARLGLKAEVLGRPFQEWIGDLLAIARGGLTRLNALDSKGENEVKLLASLDEIAESGMTLADRLLGRWEGEWGRNMDKIFSENSIIF